MRFIRYVVAVAVLAAGPVYAQQAGSPFQAQTLTFPFSATSSAGTAVQITPNTGVTSYQNYLVSNTGSNGAWITLANSSANAAQTLPSGSTPGNAQWIEPGTSRVLTGPSQAWFNAQTASGTASVNVTGGTGTLAGVAGSPVSGSSSGGGAPVTITPQVVATTDISSTISAGGTAQTAITSNSSRKGWCIQNPPGATEVLDVRVNGTASLVTGTVLSPGAQACNSPGLTDPSAISVYATTTGHIYNGWYVQ